MHKTTKATPVIAMVIFDHGPMPKKSRNNGASAIFGPGTRCWSQTSMGAGFGGDDLGDGLAEVGWSSAADAVAPPPSL
ncbi:hypothetical protein ACFU6S_01250 [Streptomyces sp. NPDC057456]|uniref:hypothetical protein n=1 Tax=Streptomyces sp. NPDC057456 TaxID=3346139 RepID=UPI00368F45D7